MIAQLDWRKVSNTVDTVISDHLSAVDCPDTLNDIRLMTLWYITGNEGDGSPHYPVPALYTNIIIGTTAVFKRHDPSEHYQVWI